MIRILNEEIEKAKTDMELYDAIPGISEKLKCMYLADYIGIIGSTSELTFEMLSISFWDGIWRSINNIKYIKEEDIPKIERFEDTNDNPEGISGLYGEDISLAYLLRDFDLNNQTNEMKYFMLRKWLSIRFNVNKHYHKEKYADRLEQERCFNIIAKQSKEN